MVKPLHILLLIACLCLLVNMAANAQTDTSGKGKSPTYIEVYYALTNTAGTFGGKSNLSVELGKQWTVFSLGIDIGKTTFDPVHGRDTSIYLEIRPNLNIFQQGRFTNTLTIGAGYVFAAQNSFLTELTSGIEYSATDRFHINVNFGQFYYSGRTTATSLTFFGISLSYYFLPYKDRSSIFKPR